MFVVNFVGGLSCVGLGWYVEFYVKKFGFYFVVIDFRDLTFILRFVQFYIFVYFSLSCVIFGIDKLFYIGFV